LVGVAAPVKLVLLDTWHDPAVVATGLTLNESMFKLWVQRGEFVEAVTDEPCDVVQLLDW
jgi:hypothetical protein